MSLEPVVRERIAELLHEGKSVREVARWMQVQERTVRLIACGGDKKQRERMRRVAREMDHSRRERARSAAIREAVARVGREWFTVEDVRDVKVLRASGYTPLVEAGYLERKEKPDRHRRNHYRVTEAGIQFARSVNPDFPIWAVPLLRKIMEAAGTSGWFTAHDLATDASEVLSVSAKLSTLGRDKALEVGRKREMPGGYSVLTYRLTLRGLAALQAWNP